MNTKRIFQLGRLKEWKGVTISTGRNKSGKHIPRLKETKREKFSYMILRRKMTLGFFGILMQLLSDVGLDDIDEGNKDFTNWLIEYNNYRPHESLDYLTPLEYAQQNFYKVLPMWSARTKACHSPMLVIKFVTLCQPFNNWFVKEEKR